MNRIERMNAMRTQRRILSAALMLGLLLVAGAAPLPILPAQDPMPPMDPPPAPPPYVPTLGLAAGDGFINMADGKRLYMFGFSNVTGLPLNEAMMAGMVAGEFPAPTIVAREGEEMRVRLINVGMMMRPDLFDAHTIHFHGYPNAAPIFDGVPDASISINMGSFFDYYYVAPEPGTYIYHCHFEATEHMQMGMLGQLYILPSQNNLPEGTDLKGFIHQAGTKYAYNDGDGSTRYDVEFPLQIGSMDPAFHDAHEGVQPLPMALMEDKYFMINGRGYPDTVNMAPIANTFNGNLSQKIHSLVTAQKGQRILLRLSTLSVTSYFTVAVHGIPLRVVAKDARQLARPYTTASITIGGGETVDLLLDTANVQPGTYVLYTTNLHFLSNNEEDYGGSMTEIVINP
jgi:FtsP/CotA-like multicopper oxidase with cupredoxin domain